MRSWRSGIVLAALLCALSAPLACAAVHEGAAAQQRLQASADAVLDAGADGAAAAGLQRGSRAQRRASLARKSAPGSLAGASRFRGAAGDGAPTANGGGDEPHPHGHHTHRPAGFGSVLSANASLALRHARSNPLFLNFSAIRAELVAMNSDFASLERQSLDALTVAEAKAVAAEEDAMLRKTDKVAGVHAANRATAAVNALRRETEALHEQDGVLRYLRGLSAEVARANASATRATARASAKDATRTALRRDAETAAGAYLGFNMAAAAQSLDAVASFLSQATGAQRAAEAWRADAELRALNAVATHLARLKAAADGVSSSRSSLKGVYSVAGAAARLVDLFQAEAKQARRDAVAAAHVDPALGEAIRASKAAAADGSEPGGDVVEQQAEQFAIVALAASPAAPGAPPGAQQSPFNASALARPPQLTAGAVRVLHGMGVRTPRIESPTDEGVARSPDDIVTVSSHDEEAASLFNMLEAAVSRVESMASRLAAAREGLEAALAAAAAAGGPGSGVGSAAGLTRQLGHSGIESLLAALRAALAEAGAQRLGAVLDGAGSARAWWLDGSAVAAEVGRLNAQADRLAAGRRVLEAELERRASRDPAAVSPGAGGAAGGANFGGSAGGSAVSSLETSVSVTVLRALLEADGSEAAAAAAADEGALRSLLSAGGGTLWHQAAELEQESRRVDEELRACKAEPSQFRPGCEPRLAFEASRLREEAAKRRAAAAAERAVLERLAAELSSALQKCRAKSSTDADADGDGEGEGEGCAAVEQAGVSAQLKAVSSALEARRQVEEDWAERTELQCLWRHRSLSLTELIAESLAKPPAGKESDGGAAGSGSAQRLSGTGEGDRLRRLTQVCAALGRQPLAGAQGADVIGGCLCPDAQASHKLLVAARSEAAKAAAARHAADAAQADAASDAASARAATQTKEEARVKEALFDYLRGRPEWAAIVGKAMSEQEGAAQTPQQAAEGAAAAAEATKAEAA